VSASDEATAGGPVALRRAFDASFAEPVRGTGVKAEAFVGIRVSGNRVALRLSEISGVFAGKKVTQLPGSTPGLMGIAGFRGAIVPVYDLGALLGYPVATTQRWMAVSSDKTPVAFAFDFFEGHLRIARGDLALAVSGDGAGSYVREVARIDSSVCPIIHTPSLLEAIKKRSHAGSSTRER
jgi:chemotaxis signal transduction protein